MITCTRVLVTLVLCTSVTLAAKEGDSGPGWKVKSYSVQGGGKVLYCQYDGVFRLKPQTDEWHSCGTTKKNSKYLTSNSLKCSDKVVQLLDFTKSRRQKWSIKQASPAPSDGGSPTYNIIEDKGKSCTQVYLSAPVSPASFVDYDEADEPVPLELSKSRKWEWIILGQEMRNGGIDCLKVGLLSANQYTYLNVDRQCNEFKYDSDIGDWELIPA